MLGVAKYELLPSFISVEMKNKNFFFSFEKIIYLGTQ